MRTTLRLTLRTRCTMAANSGPQADAPARVLNMRSDQIKRGVERAPHRALLRATGVRTEDMTKPFIAVVNSYVDIVPGHTHLQALGWTVKEAIRAAGAVALEFNTIGVDDGSAMGHEGMKFSLPSPE